MQRFTKRTELQRWLRVDTTGHKNAEKKRSRLVIYRDLSKNVLKGPPPYRVDTTGQKNALKKEITVGDLS